MENLSELIIWLIVMAVFWLLPALAKKNKQPPQPQGQASPEKRAELEEKILEALGFPVPKPIPLPQPPIIVKKKPLPVVLAKKPAVGIKAPPATAPVKAGEETHPAPLIFTPDKLQEGIILSTVLGPPKAHVFLPGWWNGRHAGLKNQ